MDSEYLFEHGENSFYVGGVLGALFLSFTFYQLYKIYKKDHYFYCRHDNGKQERRLPIAIVFGLLGLVILFSLSGARNFYRRIKNNHAETVGTTIRKYNGGGHTAPTIEYEFKVNGKTYSRDCGFTFDGEEIRGIKVPEGHYKVIYNKNNPDESVMHFKSNADSKLNN